ncbi:hypothetical protein [Nonomuraea indica]|uniref:hypothetical protein n=1 Tax=Nonomuraea indica TaxID=1581193 RepID=UPI00118261F0|nr:hypothetical protein [Nonomuraea indica]
MSAYLGRNGGLKVLVDDAQMDLLLIPALDGLSDAILSVLPGTDAARVRVHRDHKLGGTELIVAEVTDNIDVFLPHELLTKEVSKQIGLHGTRVLATFIQMAAVIGRTPPAA